MAGDDVGSVSQLPGPLEPAGGYGRFAMELEARRDRQETEAELLAARDELQPVSPAAHTPLRRYAVLASAGERVWSAAKHVTRSRSMAPHRSK